MLRSVQGWVQPYQSKSFASTFRDWCAETTKHPQEVADAALGYWLPDSIRADHQIGDLMEMRRRLMVDWAVFCKWGPPRLTLPPWASASEGQTCCNTCVYL